MLYFRRAKDEDCYSSMIDLGRISKGRSDYVMLAFDEDQMIGACSMEFNGQVGKINSLYIADKHRRQGIGYGLAKAIMFVAMKKGIEKVELTNRCDMSGLLGRLGFVENRHNPGIMELKLEGYFNDGC
jgi:N-acetylglutamate synthase-like GNAT family acetyltransferase